MVDLLLYIGLGLVQIGTATWGGIVSIKSLPPGEKRLPHIWGFIALALTGVLLITVIGIKNFQVQKENARTSQTMLTDLTIAKQDAKDAKQQLTDSRLAEEFMKGQLSGLSLMVGKINDTGSLGNKQVAAALGDIARKAEESRDTRSALERMSNPVLRTKVLQFTKEMLDWASRMNSIQQKMIDDRMSEMRSIGRRKEDEAKRDAAWNAWNVRDSQFYANYNAEFTRDFMGIATAYRDELIRRLGPQPIPSLSERPLAFEGWISPMSVTPTAIYLQKLAYKLPEK